MTRHYRSTRRSSHGSFDVAAARDRTPEADARHALVDGKGDVNQSGERGGDVRSCGLVTDLLTLRPCDDDPAAAQAGRLVGDVGARSSRLDDSLTPTRQRDAIPRPGSVQCPQDTGTPRGRFDSCHQMGCCCRQRFQRAHPRNQGDRFPVMARRRCRHRHRQDLSLIHI